MKRMLSLVAMLGIGVFMLSGCGGTEAKKAASPLQEVAPDWVMKGSGAFGGEKGKVFYGVGVAKGGQDVVRTREKCDARARAEAARTLESYVASMTEDYIESVEAGDKATEEGVFTRVMKQVTGMTLHGLDVVEHWQNPETGDMYALARIDLDTFKEAAEKANEVDGKVKEYIKKNAEHAHEKLEKELQKNGM